MNTMRSDLRHLLDLLVDNELSEVERRDLLARCEAQPDGWRSCALAFLEAQDWANTLGLPPTVQSLDVQPPGTQGIANPTGAAGVAPKQLAGPREAGPAAMQPASVSRTSRFWSVSSAIGGLAMAASLLLAFGVGMWMNPAVFRSLISPPKHDFVVGPASSERGNSAGPAAPAGRPPQTARLVVGGSTGGDEVQVPIVEGDDLDEWWRRQPTSLPADVRRALERMGHQVRERRQLLPFELEDGRRLMVPVDQIDVQPSDEQRYQ